MLPDLVHHSEKLYYFFEVALQGSLQATSRKIGVSAPSLSYAIKQLEEVCTTPLFVRSQKGVTLTPAGDQLLSFCQRYFREMEQLHFSMRESTTDQMLRVRVGTFPSIAIYFWPLLMESLEKDPNLSLSISTGRSQEILESLIKKNIDIAVTVEDFQYSGLIKHELYKDQYAFYCAADWGIARIRRDEVIQFPILYLPDAIDHERMTLRQHLYAWGLFFRDDFELDSFEVIGEFVKRGYGIGILPTKVAAAQGDAIRKLKIEGVPAGRFGSHRFFLSYRDDLDIPQSLMRSILMAARSAVREQKG